MNTSDQIVKNTQNYTITIKQTSQEVTIWTAPERRETASISASERSVVAGQYLNRIQARYATVA